MKENSDLVSTIYGEEAIYQHKTYSSPSSKGYLKDVGIRFSRSDAERLAESWRGLGYKVRIFRRVVKADGVSYPVFMVTARLRKDE